MQTFFPDIQAIEYFTQSLNLHNNTLACRQCHKSDQWVLHGFVYKQRSLTFAEPVGKRLFCSNRFGRQGCGRTVQLYITNTLPTLHYGALQLFRFIIALLANQTVVAAYQTATQQFEPRHAWRWLNKLWHRLTDYRRRFNARTVTDNTYSTRSRRLQHLLPTLKHITSHYAGNACAAWQLCYQRPFVG